MTNPTAPGWYDDPDHPEQLRYFDGVLWTKHVTPRRTRDIVPPPAGPAQPAGHDPYGWGQPQNQPPTAWQQPGAPQQPAPWGQGGAPQWQGPQRPSGPTTPDGVPLASYWQRVGAYILDVLLVAGLSLVLGGWALWRAMEPWLNEVTQAVESGDSAELERLTANMATIMTGRDIVVFALISGLAALAYHVGFVAWRGATPGKMAVKISVRERDRPGVPSLTTSLRRYLIPLGASIVAWVPGAVGLLGSAVSIADLLWPLGDGKRQALHDKIAGTNVVQGKQPPRRKDSASG